MIKAGRPGPWQTLEVETDGRSMATTALPIAGADAVQIAVRANPKQATPTASFYSEPQPPVSLDPRRARILASVPGATPEVPPTDPASGALSPATVPTGPLTALRPTIHGRAEWNARPCSDLPYELGLVTGVLVHHTTGSSTYAPGDVPAMLRAIQSYEMDQLGWRDLAYNIVVDRFGRVWEGRGGGLTLPIVGGHTKGLTNKRLFGLALLGSWESLTPPTIMIDAAIATIAWKFAVHRVHPYSMTYGANGPEGDLRTLRRPSDHLPRAADLQPVGRHPRPGEDPHGRFPAPRADGRLTVRTPPA